MTLMACRGIFGLLAHWHYWVPGQTMQSQRHQPLPIKFNGIELAERLSKEAQGDDDLMDQIYFVDGYSHGINSEPRLELQRLNVVGVPTLTRVEQHSLMKPWPSMTVSRALKRADGDNGFVTLFYHKTGNHFSKHFQNVIFPQTVKQVNDTRSVKFASGGSARRAFWSAASPVKHGAHVAVSHPSATWPRPEGARVLHYYRDPVSHILSGYRYHTSIGEAWENTKNQCHLCGPADIDILFGVCNYRCNFRELLTSVDEDTGAKLEAVHDRVALETIFANLARFRDDPNVLHISMDHLSTNFDKTIYCMLKFLGFNPGKETMQKLKELNVANYPSMHSTHEKYDNSELHGSLTNHPRWGDQFRRIHEVEMEVNLRQAHLYGCPVPA